jgi:hypothetical protein
MPQHENRIGFAVLLAAAMAIGGCGASDATSDSAKPAPFSMVAQVPPASHTVLIVLENRELGEVIGASDAPYFSRLASQGALAVNYFGSPTLPCPTTSPSPVALRAGRSRNSVSA